MWENLYIEDKNKEHLEIADSENWSYKAFFTRIYLLPDDTLL